MSSIAPGSRSSRSTSRSRTCAASSSARTDASVPFRFPIGLRTASMINASRIEHSLQPPLARYAFQLGGAAIDEREPRSCHEILDRLGDEHLAPTGLPSHTRTDRDGDARDLVVD